MKKLLITLICLLILTNIVLAADCQYSGNKELNLNGINIYETKVLEGVELSQAIEISTGKLIINIKNNLDVPIKLNIAYHMSSSWFGSDDTNTTVEVGAYDKFTYKDSSEYSCRSYPCGLENIKIYYLEPKEITLETCILCGGNICLNDGSSCLSSNECGGGHCIRGVCSNSEVCFDNNCKCSSDEIQCNDNTRCVLRNSVELDTKPICNKNEECVSGYINPTTNLCAKSPSQIEKEKDERNKTVIISIISLAIIIVFGIWIYFYLTNKNEEAKQKTEYSKQKTIQKQMEFVVTNLHTKNLELKKIKYEIREIKIHKKNKEDELKKLRNLKEKESKLFNEIVGIEQQIDEKWENLKSFPDAQAKNRLVIINPYLGGYKCFYNKELELKEYPISSLVHRWVWKHKTGSWPRYGHHIHHVDGDKYNNDPNNLEEIEGEEHYDKHRIR